MALSPRAIGFLILAAGSVALFVLVLRILRQEPGGDRPTVLFCTVENRLDRIREALDCGADEYIMKPFDGDIIAAKFAEVGLV